MTVLTPKLILFGFVTLTFLSCGDSPKVIEVTQQDATESSFSVDPNIQVVAGQPAAMANDLHQVIAEEVLNGSRYVFVKVREGMKSRWISTRSREVVPGQTYYYRGGLLKTNFESLEFQRSFDTIFLISSLVDANHAQNASRTAPAMTQAEPITTQKENISTHGESTVAPQGTISIAELVNNAAKYEGQTVQIHGTCVKINPNIMQRNWIHVQDGSKDDYDLVITTVQYLPEGTEFTMSATVTLKKDFGSGYYYDMILENGVLVN